MISNSKNLPHCSVSIKLIWTIFDFSGYYFSGVFEKFIVDYFPPFETIASQSSFKGSFVHSDMMMLFQHQRNLFVGKPFVEIMFDNTLFISTGKFVVMVFIFGLATCVVFVRKGHGQ